MKIALLQMNGSMDPAINLQTFEAMAKEAIAQDVSMLFTPEMTNIISVDKAYIRSVAKAETKTPILQAACTIAKEHGITIHIGSLAILRDDERVANRGFCIDQTGVVRARYDKMHMFDVALANGESYTESKLFAAGDNAVVVETPMGLMGLSICYDLRFPSLYEVLAVAGARVLSVPAAFTQQTGEAHWHALLRARAIENGCYVVAAAQTGTHDSGRQTYGHSLVVDPWGGIVLDAGVEPGVYTANIKDEAVDMARQRIPRLRHIRPIKVEGKDAKE